MKRALLISIHPEWAEKILNGEKTIEIRTWIPKDYVGWVYVAITKGKPYLYNIIDSDYYSKPNILNGKVVGKFILNKLEKVTVRPICGEWEVYGEETDFINLSKKSCLTQKEIMSYLKGKVGYAWHIGKLEIFDKPKELSEFIHYRRETICCGMDCPPHTGWIGYPVRKAPQKCMWVYLPLEPYQVSVLDEETPSKKDESERKPF